MIVYLYGFCVWIPFAYWLLGKAADEPGLSLFREPRFRALGCVFLAFVWPLHLLQLFCDNWRSVSSFLVYAIASFHLDYVFGKDTLKQWFSRLKLRVNVS